MLDAHKPQPRRTTETTLVILVTLLAAAVRLYHLGAKSLWLDEAVLYNIASGDWVTVVRTNAETNSGAPLFALLLHGVIQVSRSEAALRMMSAVASTAVVPVLYVLARRWMGVAGATMAVLLAACAVSQVEMAQEVREYAIAMLLATTLLLLTSRLWVRPATRDVIAWVFVGVVGIWLQYGLALLLALLGVVLFVRLVRVPAFRRWIPWWLAAQTALAVAVAGVYLVSLRYQFRVGGFGADNQSDYLSAGYWNGSLSSFLSLAVRGTYMILRFGYPRPVVLLPLLVLAVWACVRDPRVQLPMVLLLGSFAGFFVAALGRLYPYQGSHQIVMLMPMLYVVAGLGFDTLWTLMRWRWVAVVLGGLLVANGLASTVTYLRSPGEEELRPVVAALLADQRADDTVYVYYGAVPAFRYYADDRAATVVEGTEHRGDPAGYERELMPLLERQRRVWLVFSHCHADECERLVDVAGGVRAVELHTSATGATTYLIP